MHSTCNLHSLTKVNAQNAIVHGKLHILETFFIQQHFAVSFDFYINQRIIMQSFIDLFLASYKLTYRRYRDSSRPHETCSTFKAAHKLLNSQCKWA